MTEITFSKRRPFFIYFFLRFEEKLLLQIVVKVTFRCGKALFSAFWLRSSVVSVLIGLIGRYGSLSLLPISKFFKRGNVLRACPKLPMLSSALHYRPVMTALVAPSFLYYYSFFLITNAPSFYFLPLFKTLLVLFCTLLIFV
jgi:hypothetical protein